MGTTDGGWAHRGQLRWYTLHSHGRGELHEALERPWLIFVTLFTIDVFIYVFVYLLDLFT